MLEAALFLLITVISAGGAPRSCKVIGSVLHYNSGGMASTYTGEHHKTVRSSDNIPPARFVVPTNSSCPKKHPGDRNGGGEDDDRSKGSNGSQPKPDPYIASEDSAQGGN
ncbi:Mitogen-activated protein kinase [Orobanche gracilis]